MRTCPLTELGFRNAETWGKHLWPKAGALPPHPQWASPHLHWEHWGTALCSGLVSLCLEAAPAHGGSLSPDAEQGFEWRGTVCSCPEQGSPTWHTPCSFASSQISFLGRDIWATLCLVPRSQGVVPLHWGTLVTCTWVLVSLLCPGGYFSHGCSPKNSDIIQHRNLFSGWFCASRDQCCWLSCQCRVLLDLHQFRNHQWALGGGEGNNTQRFALPAWAESCSSPKQCQCRCSCCFLPQERISTWTLLKDADGTPGRVKSSWQYFTVFPQPWNVIFSAQCDACLILFPFYIYFTLTTALKLVSVFLFFLVGWLVSCFPLFFFPAGFCSRVLSPKLLNSLSFQYS